MLHRKRFGVFEVWGEERVGWLRALFAAGLKQTVISCACQRKD